MERGEEDIMCIMCGKEAHIAQCGGWGVEGVLMGCTR